MRVKHLLQRVLAAVGCLVVGLAALRADESLSTGASQVERNRANFGLYIPPSFSGTRGPTGVFVFFGGRGDSVETYMRALSPAAEAEDWVLIVPQLPWFKDPAKASTSDITRGLEKLVGEIEKQFSTGPLWVAVGGASAGGAAAHDLAKKWTSKLNLFILSSTGPFADISKPRTLHVVAENEKDRLGSDGRRGSVLGKGKKDIFLIPGGRHSAQIPHVKAWFETEAAQLRLEQAPQTLRLAEEKLRQGQPAEAEAILRSTLQAVETLNRPASGNDDFFQYETQRREEMRKKFAQTIQALENFQTKLQGSPAAAPQS